MKDIKIAKSENGILKYQLSKNMEICSGKENLIQRIVLMLLTSIGSNTSSPEFGSNFLNKYKNINSEDSDQIAELFPLVVANIVDKIKLEQTQLKLKGIKLMPDEILKDIRVINLFYIQNKSDWSAEITVITEATINTFKLL